MASTVFISSTTDDLKPFRQAVAEIAEASGWKPVRMDDESAHPSTTVDRCRELVRQGELVIVIVAWRYGSKPPGETLSYTHCEVEEARKQGLPILALVAEWGWPYSFVDQDRTAVEQFRGSLNSFVSSFSYSGHDPASGGVSSEFRELVRRLLGNHSNWLRNAFDNGIRTASDWHGVPNRWRSAFLLSAPESSESLLSEAFRRTTLFKPMLVELFREVSAKISGLGQLPDSATTLETLVEILVRLAMSSWRNDGTHAVTEFLIKVVQRVPEIAPALHDWCRRTHDPLESLLNIEQQIDLVGKQRPRPSSLSASGDSHVLVRFEPSTQDEEFKVRAWVYQLQGSETENVRRYEPVELPLEKKLWTKQNRSQQLGQLHHEAKRRIGAGRLVFEFMLPRKLLRENPEDWSMRIHPDSSTEGKIGRLYPVLVRPLERTIDLHLDSWQIRWPQVEPHLSADCQMVDESEPERKIPPRALWVRENRDGQKLSSLLAPDRHVVSAVLEHPPMSGIQRKLDPLGALLFYGIPIIAWPRKSKHDAETVRREVERLFEEGPLNALMSRLHDRRSRNDGQMPSLTLVWDDPIRPIDKLPDAPAYGMEEG